MARPIVLVKLGGSLLTDKKREGAARTALIRRLAAEIAGSLDGAAGPRLVLGHGSGSFGHVAASRAGLVSGKSARRRTDGIARVQRRAADLHRLIVGALEDAGARPFALAPSSFLTTSAGKVESVFADPLFQAVALGMVPVVYGDVVMDRTRGASIVSTEAVFVAIAEEAARRRIPVARAVWLGETDGLHDERGRTVALLSARGASRAARRASGASGVDVTGGIALRLATVARLAGLGIGSHLVDGRPKGAAAAAIAGHHERGTWVES
ncbi:MAG TPA: isopentenyl phosphate kinase [Candidatus Bathyarchaeia archaeon]|nr:isopentenyl phosphate kinase [Candidatus Bathyarchaeia archaeon]